MISFAFHPGSGLFITIHVRWLRRCAAANKPFLPLERTALTSIHGDVLLERLIIHRWRHFCRKLNAKERAPEDRYWSYIWSRQFLELKLSRSSAVPVSLGRRGSISRFTLGSKLLQNTVDQWYSTWCTSSEVYRNWIEIYVIYYNKPNIVYY
jgi:hypothetical protein